MDVGGLRLVTGGCDAPISPGEKMLAFIYRLDKQQGPPA